ncbi:MAG: transcriptional repressor [Planctomycetaceae bacterium]
MKSIDNDTETLRKLIRNAGLRCTESRLAVMKILGGIKRPISHAELVERLVPEGFDQATVFRNLNDLTDANLVSRTELGDHVWRFERKSPNDPHDGGHPHFVCVDCGSVTCLSDVEFSEKTQRRARKIGTVTEILLRGHCKACQ